MLLQPSASYDNKALMSTPRCQREGGSKAAEWGRAGNTLVEATQYATKQDNSTCAGLPARRGSARLPAPAGPRLPPLPPLTRRRRRRGHGRGRAAAAALRLRPALPLLESAALAAGELGRGRARVCEAAAPHRAVVQAAADLEVVPLQLARAQRAGRGAAGRAVAAQAHHRHAAAQAPPHVARHLVGRQTAPPRLGHARRNQAAGAKQEGGRGGGGEARLSRG